MKKLILILITLFTMQLLAHGNKRKVRVIYKKAKVKKNTIMLKLGVGNYISPGDLETTTTFKRWNNRNHHHRRNSGSIKTVTDKITYSEETRPVLGLSYSRRLGNSFRLGASAYTNKTYTIDFGLDF